MNVKGVVVEVLPAGSSGEYFGELDQVAEWVAEEGQVRTVP